MRGWESILFGVENVVILCNMGFVIEDDRGMNIGEVINSVVSVRVVDFFV